jgi:hypothetical protein
VNGYDNGTNALTGKRNGNAPGTQFVIEAMIGAATAYALVDIVTTTKYDYRNQKPGVRVVYRVRARKSGNTSDPSNQAIVYAG